MRELCILVLMFLGNLAKIRITHSIFRLKKDETLSGEQIFEYATQNVSYGYKATYASNKYSKNAFDRLKTFVRVFSLGFGNLGLGWGLGCVLCGLWFCVWGFGFHPYILLILP